MINKIFQDFLPDFEKHLNNIFPKNDCEYSMVIDAARYSLLSGGKRIRPLILAEFYNLCGGTDKGYLHFAAAIEMIHTYSLIHDDLPCMDNDDMRRGKPSCHKQFGEDIALLAGDALLTNAFSVAAKTENIPCERIIYALTELSNLSGKDGMIGGQVMDLNFENNPPCAEELLKMYKQKTGCLLVAAAKIGCILAGGTIDDQNNATVFGENLGLAFQIIDDILDTTADEKILGKPIGSDEANGKTTFVSLYGLEKAKDIAKEYTNSAILALSNFKGDSSRLKTITDYLLVRKF